MAIRPRPIHASLLASALLVFTGSPARAQDPEGPVWVRSQSSRAGLELDLWPSSFSSESQFSDASFTILAFAFTPFAQIRIVPNVFITAELPLYMVHASFEQTIERPNEPPETQSDSETEFALGNPTVGAYWTTMLAPELALKVGGRLSAPIHFDPSAETAAALYGGAARADYDVHRFAPEYLPVRGDGGIEYEATPNVHLRGDVGPILLVPLDGQDTEFAIENGAEIDYLTEAGIGGGARLQAVLTLTTGDKIQTATELFFLYETPARVGGFARAGLLVALDKNAGFGFDEGKVATLRVSGGGKF